MATYTKGGQSWFAFCAYDLEEDYFVRYEAFSRAYDMEIEDALTALAVAVGSNSAWLYPITHQQTIQPGYLVYDKAGFAVTPFGYTYSVWVGVHKIVFADGEIREVSDGEVQYFECPVKK